MRWLFIVLAYVCLGLSTIPASSAARISCILVAVFNILVAIFAQREEA